MAGVAAELLLSATPAVGAGPWKGQVVDAETGQPIEGVVVVAVWDTISPAFIHHKREFHDVDEVVTNAEGRFVIPARGLLTANPFVHLDGPQISMFRAGYGGRRIHEPKEGLSDDEWRKRMEKSGLVWELPPLKTRKERLNGLPARPSIPDTRMPRFMEAFDRERVFLGLQPLGGDKK
jgi:hypothetical protein